MSTYQEPQPLIIRSGDQIVSFINWCFQKLKVSHIEFDGKTWYPWTTMWYGCSDGYWSHRTKIDDVDEILSDDEETIEKYSPKIHVEFEEDMKLRFFNEEGMTFQGHKRVIIDKRINIENDNGTLNDDHRGSNHMALDINHLFNPFQVIEHGEYDIFDLANIVWRIKGNKFENHYELVLELEPNNYVFKGIDQSYYVSVGVDHGS